MATSIRQLPPGKPGTREPETTSGPIRLAPADLPSLGSTRSTTGEAAPGNRSGLAASGPVRTKQSRWSWRALFVWPLRAGDGIRLEAAGPVPGSLPGARAAGPVLAVAVTALATAQYAVGHPVAPEAWLAIAPLLGSLVLRPVRTALLAGWTVLLGLGLALEARGPAGRLASSLAVLVLLAAFAVANSVLRSAAQRRLGQARAVARVAQSALLREVPRSVAAARFASRYLSASAEAQLGGDVIEVIADGANPRWLVGDTRGKGLPAVRLASIAATSFRDACRAWPAADRDRPFCRSVRDQGIGRGGLRHRGVRRA